MSLDGTPIPRVGDLVASVYSVDGTLGEGGMAVVVSARHVRLNQRVAIKILQPRYAASHELRERFFREARALATLKSEHVARVFDVGTLEGGSAYIVLEYLEGVDLHDLLQRDGPLPQALAAKFMIQACMGLDEAHRNGILHRDLKPSNMFVVPEADGPGKIKLLDFGLAKLQEEGVSILTAAESVMGSPSYMSPEQIKGLTNADERSDIWSLGVTLYELLTDRFPFEGETPTKIAAAVLTLPPASLRQYAPHVSLALEDIIMRCITKDVRERVQSPTELIHLLQPFAAGSTDEPSRLALSPVPSEQGAGSGTPSPAPIVHPSGVVDVLPDTNFVADPGRDDSLPPQRNTRATEETIVTTVTAANRANWTRLLLVPLIVLVAALGALVLVEIKWGR